MVDLKSYEVWFVTGSQHLYGEETLRQVEKNSRQISAALHESDAVPVQVVCRGVATTPDAIRKLCEEASSNDKCIGLILWMHTFWLFRLWSGSPGRQKGRNPLSLPVYGSRSVLAVKGSLRRAQPAPLTAPGRPEAAN